MTRSFRDTIRLAAGILVRLAILIGLILLAGELGRMIQTALNLEADPGTGHSRVIVGGLIAYIVLTAIPFVPGAEIGMALLAVFGASVAPLVYLATVISLSLAYLIGRLVPPARTAAALRRMHLTRAADLIAQTASVPQANRLDAMMNQIAHPGLRALARYRYVALALIVNLPGSVLVGGGGGIAMLAGLSGLFAPIPFLVTILIAVLPVPLAILSLSG